ncbi:MAG: PilZ domain-containing protein [Candidatus Hydrogenedentes bacterium]|nr:PilZ domain-containing protein [Candidatus Hydrogenedentota bacterium]
MAQYNVNAAWDDPYDHLEDRRESERFDFRIKMSIAVDNNGSKSRLVGPGIVRNISLSGASLVTKHTLVPGQRITLAIPTKRFKVAEIMPAYFMGTAEVIRVEPRDDATIRAAIRFGEAFTQNMDFSVFIRSLHAVRHTLAAE